MNPDANTVGLLGSNRVIMSFQSDIILVFGNVDPRTAEHASSLWLQGYGQWLMFSGYLGNYTRGMIIIASKNSD